MKKIPYIRVLASSALLLAAGSASFAQEDLNLEQISWNYAEDTALPALSDGYDGYFVSGSLGNAKNYFVSVSQDQENAQSAYIKFGQLTTDGSNARIYLGGYSSGNSDAYFGDLTADISEAVSLERFYGGVYFENVGYNAYVGNLNTTINGDVQVSGGLGLTAGAGQVWYQGSTLNVKSSTLTINNGSYISNIYGGAHANGGVVNIENGSKLIINNANITSGGDYIVGGGSVAYGDNRVGGSNISGGSSVYLGSGANFSGVYTTYIVGGNFGYQCQTSVTGGSSVTIDGAYLNGVKVFGASQSSGVQAGLVSSVDNSKVIVKSGTIMGNIYGGGHSQSHGSTLVTGDASVEMTGGDVSGNVYGGSLYWNADNENVQATVDGNTSVKITGGTVTGNVFGGSEAESYKYTGVSVAHIGGSTSVEIGGNATINGSVYGGSFSNVYAKGNGANSDIDGSSNVVISGGTISQDVFGGGCVVNDVSGTVTTTKLSSANITVSAGKISGNIFAGGDGSGSVVSGDSKINFVGNGADIDFTGTVYGTGNNGATIGGDKIVSFGNGDTAFSGTFSGRLTYINEVAIDSNSDVQFVNSFDVDRLVVDYTASNISLAAGTTFKALSLIFGADTQFESGEEYLFNLNDIFTDDTIVLTAIENGIDFTVFDSNGSEWNATYDESGVIQIGAAVPEPATYAAIFGILSLAFAAYRRRK